MSDRTEPDMSFELFEPDKSPVQLKPDFWLEPMSRTLKPLKTGAPFKQLKRQSNYYYNWEYLIYKFWHCVDCFLWPPNWQGPVQMSGAGVRLILRSMSSSVQLKNLGLKSLTTFIDHLHGVSLCFAKHILTLYTLVKPWFRIERDAAFDSGLLAYPRTLCASMPDI